MQTQTYSKRHYKTFLQTLVLMMVLFPTSKEWVLAQVQRIRDSRPSTQDSFRRSRYISDRWHRFPCSYRDSPDLKTVSFRSRSQWQPFTNKMSLHGIVRKEEVRERHFEYFHHLVWRIYRVCVLSSCLLQMTQGHGTLRLWSHDPAELETLEAETAPASNAATRAASPPTTCVTIDTCSGRHARQKPLQNRNYISSTRI